MFDLVHRALARCLVRTTTDNFRSMPKPAAGEMIVGDFDHHPWVYRFPFAGSFGTPPARATRCVARETRRLLERFELFCQSSPLARLESGRKSHVIEQA